MIMGSKIVHGSQEISRIWKWTENVWLLKMDGKNPRNDILIPGGVKCIDSKSYLHQGNQT